MYFQDHNNQSNPDKQQHGIYRLNKHEHDTTRTTWHVQGEHDTARTLSTWHEHITRDMNTDGTSMQHATNITYSVRSYRVTTKYMPLLVTIMVTGSLQSLSRIPSGSS